MTHLPVRSGRRSLTPPTRSLCLLAVLLVAASTARAQLQVSVSSDDQYDSNPNRIGRKERASRSLGDLLGSQMLALGYDIGIAPGISLTPSYTLGLILWGGDSRQNFLQHDLSLVYDNLNVPLFHRPPSATVAPLPAVAVDTVKAGLVARIYGVADYLEEAKFTLAPAPPESQIDTSYLEELEEPEDDLDILFGDDFDTIDSSAEEIVTGGESPDTANSLKRRMAEQLLDIADSLDIADGSQELVDTATMRIRAFQRALDAAFLGEPFVAGTGMRLDSVLQALARYIPPGEEELTAEVVLFDPWDFIYAPVSLGFQPLMRNSLADYGLLTVESDSGADLLRLAASVSRGSYLATADTDLARYDNTTVDGGALLQQRLGQGFNAWLSYGIAHEAYPNEPLFENTRNSFAAQLRYQPSKRMLVALDAEYALKSYQDDLSITVRRPGRPSRQAEVAVDSAALTSLFEVGLGVFYRPWEETSVGIALAHQSTPTLHPRLLIGTTLARAGIGAISGVQSNLSDDVFSWNGDDLQLVLMQGLPWEIVGALRYDYNPRDYGRMTLTINSTSMKLQDRRDTRRTFELSLSRDFYIDLGERGSALSVGISLGQVRNSSTNFSNRAAVLANYDFNFTETYGGVTLQWGMW